jgi:pimeloyl-ACP methyl ester carboxylesterase
MDVPTLEGVTPRRLTTGRLTTRVLFSGPEDGTPVLFLHGNITSATWWEELMLSLPTGYRGIAPDQRGFGDADPTQKIEATRGMLDLVDDAMALLDHLGIKRTHVVGNSMGGSVTWRMLMTHPERLLSVTLVAPGSPYGFGGTKDVNGTPCWEDYAGSGGGLVKPDLVRLIEAGDRTLDKPFSPRAILRALVYKPPFVPAREEDLLSGTLKTHIGLHDLPGDRVKSPHWPFVAPGCWGLANAASPKYVGDVTELYRITPKPKILWVRGRHDLVVSETAASCPGALGAAGIIPDWPGPEVFPPQPMIGQTRAVLNKYAAVGGVYQEVVIEETGHVPFIEKLQEFNEAFHPCLR